MYAAPFESHERSTQRRRTDSAHESPEIGGGGRFLNADDIGTEQSAQDFFAPRQLREQFGGRERDVQEEPDTHIGPQHLGHELQVIVVHPHHSATAHRSRRGQRKSMVYPYIGLPPFGVIRRSTNCIMVKGPERVVRKTVVEAVDVIAIERHLA